MGDQLYENLDLIKPIFIFGGSKPSGADFYRRTGLFVLPPKRASPPPMVRPYDLAGEPDGVHLVVSFGRCLRLGNDDDGIRSRR